MRNTIAQAIVLIVFVVASAQGAPQPLVVVNPSMMQEDGHTDGLRGWTFYLNAPIKVLDVGWYDQNADGLSHSHRIGLWRDLSGATTWPYIRSSNVQQMFTGLFSSGSGDGIVIPAGTVAALDGIWRKVPARIFEPLPPLILQPGGYAFGGVDHPNSIDEVLYSERGGTTGRVPIDIGAPIHQGGGFQPPQMFILTSGVEIGPMLFFEFVPEPTGMGLMAACGWGLWLRSRRQ